MRRANWVFLQAILILGWSACAWAGSPINPIADSKTHVPEQDLTVQLSNVRAGHIYYDELATSGAGIKSYPDTSSIQGMDNPQPPTASPALFRAQDAGAFQDCQDHCGNDARCVGICTVQYAR